MRDFLEIAKEDLSTAQILLDSKKYSNSIYHYHQSVEKVGKYICYATGSLTSKDSFKIGHNMIKLMRSLFRDLNNNTGGLLPAIDSEIDKLSSYTQNLSDKEFINNALYLLETIDDSEKIIIDNYSNRLDALLDYIEKHTSVKTPSNIDNYIKNYIEVKMENQLNNTINLINYGTIIFNILLINILTCSKFKPDNFRYTSKELGNPIYYFNEKNEYIDKLRYLINSMYIPVNYSHLINWNLSNNK